jgi:hypothetical protein
VSSESDRVCAWFASSQALVYRATDIASDAKALRRIGQREKSRKGARTPARAGAEKSGEVPKEADGLRCHIQEDIADRARVTRFPFASGCREKSGAFERNGLRARRSPSRHDLNTAISQKYCATRIKIMRMR